MSRLHARVLALLALALGPLAPAARAQDGLVIDVRDPVSFSEGHHPGALNLQLGSGQLRSRIHAYVPSRRRALELVAEDAEQLGEARELLEELGYEDVVALRSPLTSEVMPTVTAADLRARLQQPNPPIVLDVRSPREWESGMITGARRVSHDAGISALVGLDRRRAYVCICAGGWRSTQLASLLRARGFRNVTNAISGMGGWHQLPELTEGQRPPVSGSADRREAEKRYSFTWIVGATPAEELSEEAQSAAVSGHFSNMGRLAAEGYLLAAGPVAEPRAHEDARGMFLFDVSNVSRALELTASDPAFQAGLLAGRTSLFRSLYPLGRLLELDRAAETRREAFGLEERSDMRSYVIAESADERAPQVLATLAQEGGVAFEGLLGPAGNDTSLAVMLYDNAGEAAAALAEAVSGEPIEWSLTGWYGSSSVAQLPRLARAPRSPTFQLRHIPQFGKLSVFSPDFTRYIDVFGIPVLCAEVAEVDKIVHAAHVLAQYIDNDEDGLPDDASVHAALLDGGAFLVFPPNNDGRHELRLDFEKIDRAGWRIGQDLYEDETRPEGGPHTGSGQFDASLEECWHLVSHGWEQAYPQLLGYRPGSALCDAMDIARGGRFHDIPRRYPREAWYTYDDRTCDYECMAAEYFYWGLTTRLGAQAYPGRGDEIEWEWRPETPELLAVTDPGMTAILSHRDLRLPDVLPDGTYGF